MAQGLKIDWIDTFFLTLDKANTMAKILYLTTKSEDYLQDQILIGLRKLPCVECIDYPKKDILYRDCSVPDSELYGGGFTIWKTLKSAPSIDRRAIFSRLYSGEFDIVIFGSIQRQERQFENVEFEEIDSKVIFLDGEDSRISVTPSGLVLFLKEWVDRHRRGVGGTPQMGREIFEPALNKGYYFKREKRDMISLKKNIHPISFSIPSCNIRDSEPAKEQLFQTQVQCSIAYELDTVQKNCTPNPIFSSESEYYNDIAKSKYGITMKKEGWECMRHYEIAANWTVPCFYNLINKPTECAPTGLQDLKNCISFSNPSELRRKINYIETNDLYQSIQNNVVSWVKSNTCQRCSEFMLKTAGV